ncbi:MAG: tetratricopeptide repeat protein, partial [Myxococcota bacterium]
ADTKRRDGAGDRVVLEGLSLEEAGLFLSRKGGAGGGTSSLSKRRLLPLYLEQIHALGAGDLSDDSLPTRMADAVAQRVERVDVRALRVLQAVAVFGGSCRSQDLAAIVEPGDLAGIEELARSGLVRLSQGLIEVSHPFIAELVEAFIPAEARKQLHAKVLEIVTDNGAPLEVRGEHAYRAGETMRTLVILERMGDEAYQRGDLHASVQALRRALELTRREMLESGDPLLESAILSFSRKLAQAMARTGELAGADGVVREVLDLTGPYDVSRSKLYLVLGDVAVRRQRTRDAMRHYGKALEIVVGEDKQVEAHIQRSLGRARREEGDPRGAANALRRALELHDELKTEAIDTARVAVELASVLLEADERDELLERLADAKKRSEEAHAAALVAETLGLAGRLAELEGRASDALQRYAEASQRSAEAGDTTRHLRWRDAAGVPALL